MSTVVDNRVVEMRFDNAQFERNVSTTMSTLDKLKQSLNLTGATKGLESVGTAARSVDMSGLSGSVETVGLKFSAMFSIADQALRNITNAAMNAGKRITSALTIDPIKTGFSEYETQINAVQTILANTESKGTTLNDVNKALDTLNTYADKTIYNFTEMTRNIGTFTAAGVDLDTSVKSIQGIANLAAVSGSSSQQASTAMYQLSQALAAGKVSLMDWNSVVNAGMGGQVFQDALKRTATTLGTNVDAMIAKYGSFRESLTKGEWLTAEVLTKTLEQFTMSAEEGSEQWEAFKKSLMDEGYTAKQAEEILKMANTATDAATKVKTFTQLWDTLKESAQSGWTQTWEILVGDFEEAKTLLTNVSNVVGEMINKVANARNELLKGWKDAGGRTMFIDALQNAFEGILSIVKPVKEAFREIFPPATVDQLMNATRWFAELTAKFKTFAANENTAKGIKSVFKGIFSVLAMGIDLIKAVAGGVGALLSNFTGVSGGILEAAGAIGDWLTGLRESTKEADIFGTVVGKFTGFLGNVITKLKEVKDWIGEAFSPPGFEGFVGVLQSIWKVIQFIGSAIGDALSSIGSGIANMFGEAGFFDVLNSGLTAGILVGIQKFIWGLSNPFDEVGGFLENVTGILDDVRGCFEAYQNQLQAGALLKIASAIGILAAAIFVISTIDGDDLANSLGAVTVLFSELMGSMAIFTKIGSGLKGAVKAMGLMVAMSISIAILAVSLKTISTIDAAGVAKGLIAIGGLMGEMLAFMAVSKNIGKAKTSAFDLVVLSGALLVMAKAVAAFGAMQWSEIGKGLTAIGVLLAELAAFTKLTGNSSGIMSTGITMIALGAAMKIFASVMKDFAGMKWEELGRGLAGMGGALLILAAAMWAMPSGTTGIGVGLIAVATAMKILASAMADFGGMSWSEIGKGLVAMGVALAELSIALMLMNGTLAGSAALIIAAGALAIMAPVMKTLGEMTWGQIAKGLITIAAAFAVIGIAGLLLTPLVPTILSLAAAFALFGIATLGIGAGLVLIGVGLSAIATGFMAIATAGAAGATAFVAGLTVIITGILDLIPTVAAKLGEAVITFAKVIAEGAPALCEAAGALLDALLDLIVTYVPKIVDAGIELLLGLLSGISENIEEVITLAIDIVLKFIKGIAESIGRVIQAGVDLMISFINGMADAIRKNHKAVIKAVDNLMDAVIEAIGAWIDSALDMGKDLIGGFIKGLKDKAKDAVEAAKGVVSDALEGAKKLLGINSPSKEFAKLGRWSDEGLVVGLEKYAGKVVRAAEGVGSGALNGISSAISGIPDLINFGIDANPTIRPVLDLSDVRSGAGAIGDMFGTSVGVSAHVGSISTMMNRRGQNGVNGDVVSAINKLRKDMLDNTGTSYTINGLSYSGDSDLDEAFKTIVRHAKIERRV